MAIIRPSSIFFTLSLLVGCSDYQLRALPTEPAAQLAGSTQADSHSPVSDLPGFHSPGPASSGLSSPWGSLDPGSLPDEYFAVAWNDPRTACVNCYMPEYEHPRYGIVDVTGQLLVSFEPPVEGMLGYHLWIQPGGPGSFLAATEVYGSDEPNFPIKLWRGDGHTGETELLLEWGWGNTLLLPATGGKIELPQMLGQARLLADPVDPDRVYLLTQNTSMYAYPLLGTLYSIHLRDLQAPVLVWEAEDMVPSGFVSDWGTSAWFPWLSEAFHDGDHTVIVLGVTRVDEAGVWRTELVAFSPELGPMDWSMNLTEVTSQQQLLVRPPSQERPGQVVFHREEESWCPQALFARWDGELLDHFDGSEELICSRLGPMLDERGDTFIYYGNLVDPDDDAVSDDFFGTSGMSLQHRLVVSHEGQDVWELQRFQEGLSFTPFDLHGLVRLAQPTGG